MAGSLRSRLARAREMAQATRSDPRDKPKTRAPASSGDRVSSAGTPAGWSEAAPFLRFRSVRFPNPLPEALDVRPYLGRAAFSGGLEGKGVHSPYSAEALCAFPAERLVFFDLETTGLSGGAGTVAFLAALGRVLPGPVEDGFEVRQYLLTDYPGEEGFLDAILGELKSGDILGSFNGRSFDEPLLRTRCVLNRRQWPRFLHADFLHTARRLWRGRFPDCSLGTLERFVLKRSRAVDVPSSSIPDIWFEFLKTGDHPLLSAAAEHNAVDIESLAGIAAECVRINANPLEAQNCDLTALGALWLTLDAEKGIAALERSHSLGDARAGWMLLKHYRRQGRQAEYERILGSLPASWAAWVERSKHAEHRLGDARSALEAARDALAFADSGPLLEDLERRLARLERKIEAISPEGGRRARPR